MHPELLIQRERTHEIYCHSRSFVNSDTAFHFHSNVEIYLVEDGMVDVWVNQKYRRLRAGELAVVLSYDAHRYEPVDGAVITCLIVPVGVCAELNGKSIDDPFVRDPGLFEGIRQCCEVIAERRNSMLTDGCVQVVLGLLLETQQFTQRESAADPGEMTQALLYLHDHFKGRVSLASAASALGFNPSYLSRRFKESLGIGFNQYLTMIRLREAVLLLSKGNPVDFCAYESGFNSVRTFYRAFCNEFGCTPREYLREDHILTD